MSNEESVAGINVRELRDENQRLEEALREARSVLVEVVRGEEDSPLVAWDVIGTIDAALSSEAPEKEEGEDD